MKRVYSRGRYMGEERKFTKYKGFDWGVWEGERSGSKTIGENKKKKRNRGI